MRKTGSVRSLSHAPETVITPFTALFSESTARALVAVPRAEEQRLLDLCTARGVPVIRLGETSETGSDEDGAPALEVSGLFTIPLAELREASEATLPRYFG